MMVTVMILVWYCIHMRSIWSHLKPMRCLDIVTLNSLFSRFCHFDIIDIYLSTAVRVGFAHWPALWIWTCSVSGIVLIWNDLKMLQPCFLKRTSIQTSLIFVISCFQLFNPPWKHVWCSLTQGRGLGLAGQTAILVREPRDWVGKSKLKHHETSIAIAKRIFIWISFGHSLRIIWASLDVRNA